MAMQYNVVYDTTVKDDVVPKLVGHVLDVLLISNIYSLIFFN